MPATVTVNHFSVRAAKSGFFALPFVRSPNGTWQFRALQTTGGSPVPTVGERHEPGVLILDFNIPELGGGLMDNPANYDRVDVAVRVIDSKGEQHTLANEAVPTEH